MEGWLSHLFLIHLLIHYLEGIRPRSPDTDASNVSFAHCHYRIRRVRSRYSCTSQETGQGGRKVWDDIVRRSWRGSDLDAS